MMTKDHTHVHVPHPLPTNMGANTPEGLRRQITAYQVRQLVKAGKKEEATELWEKYYQMTPAVNA